MFVVSYHALFVSILYVNMYIDDDILCDIPAESDGPQLNFCFRLQELRAKAVSELVKRRKVGVPESRHGARHGVLVATRVPC